MSKIRSIFGGKSKKHHHEDKHGSTKARAPPPPAFGESEGVEDVRIQLNSRVQGQREIVREYSDDLYRLAAQALNNDRLDYSGMSESERRLAQNLAMKKDDELLRDIFIRGLLDDLKNQVIREKPQTMLEARRLAAEFEVIKFERLLEEVIAARKEAERERDALKLDIFGDEGYPVPM